MSEIDTTEWVPVGRDELPRALALIDSSLRQMPSYPVQVASLLTNTAFGVDRLVFEARDDPEHGIAPAWLAVDECDDELFVHVGDVNWRFTCGGRHAQSAAEVAIDLLGGAVAAGVIVAKSRWAVERAVVTGVSGTVYTHTTWGACSATKVRKPRQETKG